MTYDLRYEVRHLLETSDLTDPGDIADKIVGDIPEASLREVVRVTLRPFVTSVMNAERVATFKSSGTDQEDDGNQTPTVGAGFDLDRGEGGQATCATQGWNAAPPRSWKRDLLRQRVHVGDEVRKFLADCTAEDITAAALEREALSAKNAAWADRYRKLAHRMGQFHADTVRDMPYDTVAAILRGDPA